MTFFVDLAGIFYIVMRPEFKKPFLWAVGCTVEEFFAMLTIALVIIIVGTGGQDATPDRWTRTFTGFQSMVLYDTPSYALHGARHLTLTFFTGSYIAGSSGIR